MDIMISIPWQMFRGLSESHTSHSITRNTLLLPNFAQNNQPKHSPWLILVQQLRPSVMLKKHANQRLPFPDLGDHSHHWLHLLMTRFVCCHQISLAKQEERKKDKKMRINRNDKRKVIFPLWKISFEEQAKRRNRKKQEQVEKNKKGQRKILKRDERWREEKKGREMGWCNECPAAEINDRAILNGCRYRNQIFLICFWRKFKW